jgi:hypothetical protein
VTGEEDLDILGILPTVAAIAFVYLFVFPVRSGPPFLVSCEANSEIGCTGL